MKNNIILFLFSLLSLSACCNERGRYIIKTIAKETKTEEVPSCIDLRDIGHPWDTIYFITGKHSSKLEIETITGMTYNRGYDIGARIILIQNGKIKHEEVWYSVYYKFDHYKYQMHIDSDEGYIKLDRNHSTIHSQIVNHPEGIYYLITPCYH